MRKDLLESGEFYGIRFQNFSTLLIIPVTLLLIGTILFSLVAKREIVINGTGTVQPTGTVPVIQATVNSAIKKNYLVEGVRVKKGQKLLVYTNVFNRNKLREDNVSKRQLQRQVIIWVPRTIAKLFKTASNLFNGESNVGSKIERC